MLLQTIEGLPSDGLTAISGISVSEQVNAPLKKVASQSDDFQFDDDVAPGEFEDADDIDDGQDDDFDEDDFDDDFDDDFEDWRDEDTDEFEELEEIEGVPFSDDSEEPCIPDIIKEDLVDDDEETEEEEVFEEEEKEDEKKGKKKKK